MAALEHESPAAAGGASPWEASTPRRVVQCVPRARLTSPPSRRTRWWCGA